MYEKLEENGIGNCAEANFSKNITRCDRWLFEDNERTILHEVNIFVLKIFSSAVLITTVG